jgi:hypothetical protein
MIMVIRLPVPRWNLLISISGSWPKIMSLLKHNFIIKFSPFCFIFPFPLNFSFFPLFPLPFLIPLYSPPPPNSTGWVNTLGGGGGGSGRGIISNIQVPVHTTHSVIMRRNFGKIINLNITRTDIKAAQCHICLILSDPIHLFQILNR